MRSSLIIKIKIIKNCTISKKLLTWLCLKYSSMLLKDVGDNCNDDDDDGGHGGDDRDDDDCAK